jgi:hypothetical protein
MNVTETSPEFVVDVTIDVNELQRSPGQGELYQENE